MELEAPLNRVADLQRPLPPLRAGGIAPGPEVLQEPVAAVILQRVWRGHRVQIFQHVDSFPLPGVRHRHGKVCSYRVPFRICHADPESRLSAFAETIVQGLYLNIQVPLAPDPYGPPGPDGIVQAGEGKFNKALGHAVLGDIQRGLSPRLEFQHVDENDLPCPFAFQNDGLPSHRQGRLHLQGDLIRGQVVYFKGITPGRHFRQVLLLPIRIPELVVPAGLRGKDHHPVALIVGLHGKGRFAFTICDYPHKTGCC